MPTPTTEAPALGDRALTDRALVGRWMRLAWTGSPLALGVIVVFSVTNAALAVTFPWLWQAVIDEIGAGASPPRLAELAMWMTAVGVGQSAMYVVLQGARSVMNARISWRARRRVFDHLTALPPAFYHRSRSGDLVTRLSDDAGEKIAWFLCSGVFRALEASLIVIACLAVMVQADPWLTLQVVLPLPLLMAGQAAAQGALGRRYRAVQEAISQINDALTVTFSGIRVVQACRLQETARRRFVDAAERQRAAEVSTARVQQAVFMMYGYGWQLTVVALLLAGGSHVLDGTITLGQFVSFEGFVMTLVWPMFDVGMFVSKYKQTAVALSRLQVLLDEPASPPPADDAAPIGPPAMALARATAQTAAGAVLLRDVDLTVPAGTTTAVVGAIGSGKSTLLDVLAGQRTLTRGSLHIGGLDAAPPRSVALRKRLGHVPQDPVLLSATLRENLLLGREIDADTLEDSLEVSRLQPDLVALPDGIDTAVGERGVTLSGGQQQRAAIARALAGRPGILLLDDATSALDADTEAAFWERLESAQVTVVMVTHRVSTIQQADQIVVLQDGAVVQRGSHAELMAEGGEYRRVYGRLSLEERLR